MAIDYKDKIRKLLALAESSNENEAREAMLRAQELMVKHKLTEADLDEPASRNVVAHYTEITCSKRREPWIVDLCEIISDNYCCYGMNKRAPGQQTRRIGFAGLADDVEICTVIFEYAVDCVRASIRRLRKECGNPPPGSFAPVSNGYGLGFAAGLKQQFEEQKAKNAEWGLVLIKPKEVNEAMANVRREHFRSAAIDCLESGALRKGYEDGKQFDPTRRLKA